MALVRKIKPNEGYVLANGETIINKGNKTIKIVVLKKDEVMKEESVK